MPDPFADPEMRERAAKLLRLLASDATGEADAARTALLRLLARHGASLDDLTRRLLDPASASMPASAVVASSGAATGLPGDLAALRAALAAAERRATLAEAVASTAIAEAERLRSAGGRLRVASIAGAGVAALLLALAWLPGRHAPAPVPVPSAAPAMTSPVIPAPASSRQVVSPQAAGATREPAPEPAEQPPRPAARTGRVLPGAGVPLRLDPVPDASPVAILPEGTQVAIDQAFPMLGVDWLQVRTPKGAGFVPAAGIGPE